MVPRFWLTVLVTALVLNAVLSGWTEVAVLGDGSAESGLDGAAATAGLVSLAVVLVAAVALLRRLRLTDDQLARQAQIIDAAGSMTRDWLWESDPEGRISYSSPGISDLLGYAPDEVTGAASEDLMYDEQGREEARRLFRSARVTQSGWQHFEGVWRHADGSPVRLQGAAVPIKDARGHVLGFRGARRPTDGTAPLRRTVEVQQRIDDLLAGAQVAIALQPLVSLVTGEVVGVEALARFADGRGPDQWFSEAEECGRQKELDRLTFTTAVDLLDWLPEAVYLSVNAGPELIVDAEFRERLAGSGIPLDRLVNEITEHARVSDYAALKTAADALRGYGVRFAIDDTGAGYASLNHVLQLRPDIVKLDRTLITNLEDDPARRSLVTALVLLALEIGATVTGEGVESHAQLETLSSLGVDHVQGYLLAKPTTDQAEWSAWWGRRWLSTLTAPRGISPAAG